MHCAVNGVLPLKRIVAHGFTVICTIVECTVYFYIWRYKYTVCRKLYGVQYLPEEQDKWRIPTWISCHSPQTVVPLGVKQSPILFRLRSCEIWGIPADLCTVPTTSGSAPAQHPPVPCRQCSALWHSCWLHPPCRWSAAPDGTADDMSQFWLHL